MKKTVKKYKTKRKKKQKKKVPYFLGIIFSLILLGLSYNKNPDVKIDLSNRILEIEREKEKAKEKEKAYLDCMNNSYQSDDLKEQFETLFSNYKDQNIAIYFSDLNNKYEYFLNETKNYYSASTIKLFDAIYLIEQAKAGKIDLNDTITYTKEFRLVGSEGMKNHKIGDKVPIKVLIKYAISVSDNAAHFMLVKYIGANNLNNYFKNNYNISLQITNERPFVYNYTASLANTSLKIIYDILKENDEYSNMLKEAMNNDYINGLNFDNFKFLHKYGFYDSVYIDIGIYDDKNPYLISILTLSGEKGYNTVVPKISKEIHEIYHNNLNKKEEYCHNL